jgi:hypothetical protein
MKDNTKLLNKILLITGIVIIVIGLIYAIIASR